MSIALKIKESMEKASFIRKMFEEGARLKAAHGAENVFDFSLGNPNLTPPAQFREALLEEAAVEKKGVHSYMPNVGYPDVREAVAKTVSTEQGTAVSGNEIIMTCGAAGALNVVFKTILDAGDEVLTPAPYFVEYNFYAENHNGILKTVNTNDDFTLNIDAIEKAITPKTKVLLINSPNNPTGQIYSEESLNSLGALLDAKSREFGKTIYMVSDEPYRKIVYDGAVVPSIFLSYKDSILVTSYSKDISIPGERIGFLAVNPDAVYLSDLMNGFALSNRILGYVNAPALMQRVIARVQGATVDMTHYANNRKLLCEGLKDCGYDFVSPPGTFYLFPKSPVANDIEFTNELQKELILVVPGTGFGGPGHFRISFCVEAETITGALPGFEKVMKKYK